jgi:hypothetical protein
MGDRVAKASKPCRDLTLSPGWWPCTCDLVLNQRVVLATRLGVRTAKVTAMAAAVNAAAVGGGDNSSHRPLMAGWMASRV